MQKISIFGNCQARGISACLRMMLPDMTITTGAADDIRSGKLSLTDLINDSDVVVMQTTMKKTVLPELERQGKNIKLLTIPTIFFSGYHPDFVYATSNGDFIKSPLGNPNSALILYAWLVGYDPLSTLKLFNKQTFRKLGYFEYFDNAKKFLLEEANALGLSFLDEFDYLSGLGNFVHTPNHPKLAMLASISRVITDKLNLKPAIRFPENILVDELSTTMVWPVYPEIAEELGVSGEYIFSTKAKSTKKVKPTAVESASSLNIFTLKEFIEKSFEYYADLDSKSVTCSRFNDARYKFLTEKIVSSHPYTNLPDHHFWKKSLVDTRPSEVDPVVKMKFKIDNKAKIATAGSCFAQHIARALQNAGFNYYIAEDTADLDTKTLIERQFGVFSARYGNIYTSAQLLQLFERAEGTLIPEDEAWQRPDGVFIDPFRPQIEPSGFRSLDALRIDRAEHFASVRRMWQELDVFIFTLGLTEAWRAKADGAVFPLAPGVSGGEMNTSLYEFHNFSVDETVENLKCFLQKLHQVNSSARVVITVSPVPLMATYEDTHVLQATTYSKSVLRVAADRIAKSYSWVDYFPSYEIITGSFNRGAYYGHDLRSITEAGIEHVMRLFFKHATTTSAAHGKKLSNEMVNELSLAQNVVCEEELLN